MLPVRMTDPFALLELPATLLLDPADIDAAWRDRRSDDTDDEDTSAINKARSRLLDPVQRLEAWLSLQVPGQPADRSLDPSLMDLFGRIGPVLSQTDELLERHRRTTTALAKAMLTREAIAAQLSVQEQLAAIQERKQVLIERFAELERSVSGGDCAEAHRSLGQLKFLRRWETQCRERLLALIAT